MDPIYLITGFLAVVILGLLGWIARMKKKLDSPEAQARLRAALEVTMAAAATGDAPAQMKLGIAYHEGLGLPTNHAEGYFWLSLSLKGHGDDPDMAKFIAGFRDAAQQRLTPDEKSALDRRVADWRPGSYAASTDDILPPAGRDPDL